ncbi:MAG TPA: hypothetical protein VG102_01320 [Candidatus Paceibacterota bacterium]|nr:hypothetical protein [Candidatus Paceibacterota bacterium]
MSNALDELDHERFARAAVIIRQLNGRNGRIDLSEVRTCGADLKCMLNGGFGNLSQPARAELREIAQAAFDVTIRSKGEPADQYARQLLVGVAKNLDEVGGVDKTARECAAKACEEIGKRTRTT